MLFSRVFQAIVHTCEAALCNTDRFGNRRGAFRRSFDCARVKPIQPAGDVVGDYGSVDCDSLGAADVDGRANHNTPMKFSTSRTEMGTPKNQRTTFFN